MSLVGNETPRAESDGSTLGGFAALIGLVALALLATAALALVAGVWVHLAVDLFEFGWELWERGL